MSESSNYRLCLELARAESEDEVIKVLTTHGLWDNDSCWEYYGRNENNFSTIGNQQSSPDTALVEKIINSVDAVLLRECLRAGISPQGSSAPTDVKAAQEKFFNIQDGKLSSISASARTKLAENIMVVATGARKQPCYSIIDKGEGQTPGKFEDTFLSLNGSNKLRIPFVQGKFNMGSTGSLQFCGQHNMQLIISRKDPQLKDSDDRWGFTVIRREDPSGGMRSSTFKYLKIDGSLPAFKAESLPLLPGDYPHAYGLPMEFGSFIKLYDYDIRHGLNTIIKFEFYYRFSLLMPNIALPVMLLERRQGYKSDGYYIPVTGLSVRLDDDKTSKIEEGFPSSSEISALGEQLKVQIYTFKPGKKENYASKEGVIFTYNGQAHGFLNKTFFERKAVGMSYLSDSILVMIDCSDISGRSREDLFMNSRDRLREGPLLSGIERELEKILREHPGLRLLREERKRDEVENKLKDSKPLADALRSIINKSPALANLLSGGFRLQNPFLLEHTGVAVAYEGKRFATHFTPSKNFDDGHRKHSPVNQRVRLQFETDAVNDYFARDSEPGELSVSIAGSKLEEYSLSLWNGKASLTLSLPGTSRVGDLLEIITEVQDPRQVDPFVSSSFIVVEPAAKKQPSPPPTPPRPTPPSDDKEGAERQQPSGLSLPEIVRVTRDEWAKYNFNDRSSIDVKELDGSYTFYINNDNAYLKAEQKSNAKIGPEILEARYSYALVLLGMSLIHHLNSRKDDDEEVSTFDSVRLLCDGIAPILLPTIAALGDLSEE